ncbi:hypothetical protein [Cellulomonas sp. PhB143]|uniref:hypothetical protein n=1 Tax=Cellulomonas sp. PhB143 TaxID=2485186 RepID=UPI000F476C31|nr:hypothetical protein [Cellulomonas sp. PhB143]ROS76482.1 hypothetical protein EDF32_1296 [Cellulomonas sp. PhB143]
MNAIGPFALIAIGRRLGGRGLLARLRFVVIALGSLLLTLSLSTLVVAHGTAQLTAERSQAVSPELVEDASHARALYSVAGFDSVGDEPVTVLLIAPVGKDAPLPAGVNQWPRPGHAIISPALADALSAHHSRRFGPVDAIISPEGLERPNELRVYLRPPAGADTAGAEMMPVTGFGGQTDNSIHGAGFLYAAKLSQIDLMLVVCLTLPALACLFLGAITASTAMRRRSTVLSALGADRARSMLIGLGEHCGALAVGTAVAAATVGVATLTGIRLDVLHADYPAADLRTMAAPLALAVVVGALLATATVLATREIGRRYRTRDLLGTDDRPPMLQAVLAPCVVTAVIWLTAQSPNAALRIYVLALGTVAVALLLPALVSAVLHLIGKTLTATGWSVGGPALLTGGRGLERFPTRTARLAAGVCFAILLLGQVQLWASTLGAQYYAAEAGRDMYGTTVVSATISPTAPGLSKFLTATAATAAPVWEVTNVDDAFATTHLVTTCRTATLLGAPCSATPEPVPPDSSHPQLDRIIQLSGSEQVTLQTSRSGLPAIPDGGGATLDLVARDGTDLSLDTLNRAAYATVPGGLQLDTPEHGWIISGEINHNRGRWATLYGIAGTLAIALATACLLARDAVDSGRRVIPLSAATGRRSWLLGLALIRTTLPLTVAGIAAACAYYLLPAGMTVDSGLITGAVYFNPSVGLAVAMALVPTLVGLVIAVIVGQSQRRDVARWRPDE